MTLSIEIVHYTTLITRLVEGKALIPYIPLTALTMGSRMGLEFKAVSLMVLCLFNQALICQNTCLVLAILEDFEVNSTLVKEVNLTLLLLILLETTNFTTHLLHPYVQVCCCFLWLFPKLWEIVITVLPIEERLFQSPFKWPKYDFGFSLVHWWSKIFQCSHGSSLQQPVNCECFSSGSSLVTKMTSILHQTSF